MVKATENTTKISLESGLEIRRKAFAKIREHADHLQRIGNAIEFFDHSLQTHIAIKGVDNQRQLVSATRQLEKLIESYCEVPE